MSYKQVVLRDNPLAFWPLNGTSLLRTYATILLEYRTYQDWISAEPTYGSTSPTFTLQDISTNGNHGAYTIGQPNFLDILPLATLSSYDTQLAGCKINGTSEVGITNLAQLYDMFYTGTENLTFGMEIWLAFDSNPPLNNTLLSVTYLNDTIAQVYINNDRVYFTINGKDKKTGAALSYTAYKQVQSWESQCHLFVYYSKGTINVVVNGISGNSATASSNFIWSHDTYAAPDFFYKVGPSSGSNNFVVNDLAFYDYTLSQNQIRSHMVWGTYDSSPQSYVKQTSGYFFDIKENDAMYAYKKNFSDPKNYSQGVLTNLITDNNGLTLKTIPSLTKAGTSGAITTSNGLSVTNTASAKFSNISSYFDINSMSIMGQINWQSNTTGNPAVIFAAEGFNNGEWLYLAQDTSNKLTLYYHSISPNYPYIVTENVVAQLPAQNTAGTYNFGVAINSTTVKIYMSNTGSSNGSLPSYTYANLNLYFGNQYSSATTSPMVGSISYMSLLPKYVDPSTYTNYGAYDSTTISFINNTAVSQIGTWTLSVPSSQFAKIFGARMTWDTGSYYDSTVSTNQSVNVQLSQDYGKTWTNVLNGYPALKYPDSATAYTDTIFKTTIFTADSSSQYLPRMDNALVVFYNDLSIISDAGAFVLAPRQGSYTGDTYSIEKNFFNILARSSNFGIKIAEVNNANSVATITPAAIATGYQTIEFWFRWDQLTATQVQIILDTIGIRASLYFDSTGAIYQTGFGNVYVNGLSLTSGKTMTQGESYHFVCVYPYSINTQIYLGGDQRLQNFSNGTFGYVSIYPQAFAQSDAQTRYLEFLSSNVSQVDYSTLLSGASNIIGTLSEYSGGSTAFNAGQPILAYPHPVNG